MLAGVCVCVCVFFLTKNRNLHIFGGGGGGMEGEVWRGGSVARVDVNSFYK